MKLSLRLIEVIYSDPAKMKLVLLGVILASSCIGTFGIPCSKSDPEVQTCLHPWVVSTVKNMSLDPMYKDFVAFSGSDGFTTINGNLTNMTVTGLNNSDITYRYDAATNRANVSHRIPELIILANEKTNARILFFGSLKSDGYLNFKLVNLTTNYIVQFYEGNGIYQIQSITVLSNGIQTGSMQITSTNPANQQSDDFMANYFNSNPQERYKGFKNIFVVTVPPLIIENANPTLAQYQATNILIP